MLLRLQLGVGKDLVSLRRAQLVQRMLRALGHLPSINATENPLQDDTADVLLLAGEALPLALPASWQLAAVLPREDATPLLLIQNPEADLINSQYPAQLITYHALLAQQWRALHSQHRVQVWPTILTEGLQSLFMQTQDAALLPRYVLQHLGLPHDGQPPAQRLLPPWGAGHLVLLTRTGDHGLTQALQALHHAPSATALRLEQLLRSTVPQAQLAVQVQLLPEGLSLAVVWVDDNADVHQHALHGPTHDGDVLVQQMAAHLRGMH